MGKTISKQAIITFSKGVISIGLLAWVIQKTDLYETWIALKSADILLFLLSLGVILCSYYFRAYRLSILLESRGVYTTKPYLFKSYMVGIFFSNFLPSIIGGDIVRVYDIWRLEPNKSIAVSTVFLDRLLGLVALLLFAIGALITSHFFSSTSLILLLWKSLVHFFNAVYILIFSSWKIVLILGTFFLLLMFSVGPKVSSYISYKTHIPSFFLDIQRKLANIVHALLLLSKKKEALVHAFAWSLVIQVAVITHYYLIAKSLDFPALIQHFFLIIPLATAVMMLPISINGIGLRENVFIFFFSIFSSSITRSEAMAFAWLSYSILLIEGVFGGFIYGLKK